LDRDCVFAWRDNPCHIDGIDTLRLVDATARSHPHDSPVDVELESAEQLAL